MKRRRIVTRAALIPALVAVLAGCAGQELQAQLSEPQANEMVAALRTAGVPAEKAAREAGLYAVVVPTASFAQAVDILRAQGLPRGGFDTLGQVFKKEGFMSSPLEERARLTHALSQEIANTLSNIDGVVLARVHVSMPEKDRLAEHPAPAAASVFVKHRAGVDLSAQVAPIKALVVHAIEGLAYENVTVALFPADEGVLGAARPLADRATAAPLGMAGAGLGIGVVLLLAGLRGVRWPKRSRQAVEAGHGH